MKIDTNKMADGTKVKEGKKGAGGGALGITPSGPAIPGRLPSFRGPRDLTLSASTSGTLIRPTLATRARKTFSPNIPVRREKSDKLDQQCDKGGKRGRDRDKGRKNGSRGRGRAREFVQTTGSLFGEGIAGTTQRRGLMKGAGGFGGGGGGGGGKSGDAGFIHKPVLNLESVNNIDKEHEDQKLKEILRDNFIDDSDDGLSRFGDDDDLLPVQLPMVDTGRGFKEEDAREGKQPIPVKMEVKSEPNDSTEDFSSREINVTDATEDKKPPDRKLLIKGGLPVHKKTPEVSVPQLLTGKHEELIFIQLPNSLPSHPPMVKQEPNSLQSKTSGQQDQQKTTSNTVSSEDEEKKPTKQFCTLNTLPEGRIGTLKIYKSGKVELWFGDHKLTVDKGTQVGFLQDVASVDVDEENKTGDMTVLGHVRHRLVCTPDLETLVKQTKT
ncbi:hypothetical protein Pmani_018827 [Petrolisthes manimaculis]|uniref:DNA-directed RNA polymerase III subunit RPC4 n=1 Tax=Petrolisthes manimaculis TaxID=1843537 RepID=A0AAE1PLR3_9EUCA|nr:hypothetical protein Pmani_018827 [Petrolisthes manimaculis]